MTIPDQTRRDVLGASVELDRNLKVVRRELWIAQPRSGVARATRPGRVSDLVSAAELSRSEAPAPHNQPSLTHGLWPRHNH